MPPVAENGETAPENFVSNGTGALESETTTDDASSPEKPNMMTAHLSDDETAEKNVSWLPTRVFLICLTIDRITRKNNSCIRQFHFDNLLIVAIYSLLSRKIVKNRVCVFISNQPF